jgi:hypothetical protein
MALTIQQAVDGIQERFSGSSYTARYDHTDENGNYVIQVSEFVIDHTVTYDWYVVNPITGDFTTMFGAPGGTLISKVVIGDYDILIKQENADGTITSVVLEDEKLVFVKKAADNYTVISQFSVDVNGLFDGTKAVFDDGIDSLKKENRFSNGDFVDPRPNVAAAVKVSGGIATDNLYLKDSALLMGGDAVINFPNGQYMIFGQGVGATVFRGHQTRLVFHDGSPYLRVESWNGGACSVEAQGFNATSDKAKKKNIEVYEKSALAEINSTPIYEYNMEGEIDGVDLKHVGIMAQESPIEVAGIVNPSVDLYAMATMSWKAIQELSAELAAVKKELAEIKK